MKGLHSVDSKVDLANVTAGPVPRLCLLRMFMPGEDKPSQRAGTVFGSMVSKVLEPGMF